MNYNNCEKKRKESYNNDCSSSSSSSNNCNCNCNCGCGCNCGYNNQQPISYKDSVLSCGGSVSTGTTILPATTTTVAPNLGSITVNNNCVKCPATVLTYLGTATIVATAAVAAGATITFTVNKVCGFNSTAVPVGQVTVTLPAIAAAATLVVPTSFQVCDRQMCGCNYNSCCNNNCSSCCSYTITATTSIAAATATVTASGNSLTALTSSSSCCCCY